MPDKLHEGEEIEWPVPFWFVDAGAALMMLLLAAIDEGLAAGLTGVEGEEDAVERLVRFCHVGPSDSRVDRVEVHVEAPEGVKGFAVR